MRTDRLSWGLMASAFILGRLQRPLGRLTRELRSVLANAGSVPLGRQIDLWRHGFYGEHAFRYDFDRHGLDAYVSDLERARRLSRINDPIQRLLINDKLVTYLFLRSVHAPTPEVYAISSGEQPVFLHETAEVESVEQLLELHGKLVVKPRGASGGDGFWLLEHEGDTTLVNGEPHAALRDVMHGHVVLTEAIEQHPYAQDIYPHSVNTLRVVVLRDADTGEPFVAAANHRFGTELSRPVDNTTAGGMAAGVDVETGVIGALPAISGIHFKGSGPVRWQDHHPDSGVRVRGTVVPYWADIVEELRRLTLTLEGLHCIGWDVAVTPNGFTIIEGNNRPDVKNVQVHTPLLANPRSRRFFEAHEVVSATPRR